MKVKSFENYNILIFSIVILFFSFFVTNVVFVKIIYIISILLLLYFCYNHILIFNITHLNKNEPNAFKAYITNYILILCSLLLIIYITYHIIF